MSLVKRTYIDGETVITAANLNDIQDSVIALEQGGISNKMDKVNPTGTGSFSLNRKANTTVGNYSTAEGYNNEASGNYSHAEGEGNRASGNRSHAEGVSTIASGYEAHAEGAVTTASGGCSHAEGYGSTASGDEAHAEGGWCEAIGNLSHAEGNSTKAASQYQHVQGMYNVVDSNDVYADIIGNGGGDGSRKNIEATTWTGDKRLKGDVYVHCNDNSTGGLKLATESDFEQFQQSVQSEFDKTDLLKEEIFGTTQQINFNSAGQVSSIVHKKGSTTYRTDTFTYGTNTITEARTISVVGTLTIVTNLTTLVTTVTFTAA